MKAVKEISNVSQRQSSQTRKISPKLRQNLWEFKFEIAKQSVDNWIYAKIEDIDERSVIALNWNRLKSVAKWEIALTYLSSSIDRVSFLPVLINSCFFRARSKAVFSFSSRVGVGHWFNQQSACSRANKASPVELLKCGAKAFIMRSPWSPCPCSCPY